MPLWTNNGKLVSNAGGTAVLDCDDCPCGGGECANCEGEMPQQFKVVLDGLDEDAVNCAALNGTWFLDFSGGEVNCAWTAFALVIGGTTLTLQLFDDFVMQLDITDGAGRGLAQWRISYSGRPECAAIENEQMSLIRSDFCETTGSTCFLSAVPNDE